MILRGRKSREWTITDRTLAIALTLTNDMLCSGCGQPKHEAWNPDSDGYFKVKDADCQSCAMLEQDSKANKDADLSRKVWTINTRTPADPPLRLWTP